MILFNKTNIIGILLFGWTLRPALHNPLCIFLCQRVLFVCFNILSALFGPKRKLIGLCLGLRFFQSQIWPKSQVHTFKSTGLSMFRRGPPWLFWAKVSRKRGWTGPEFTPGALVLRVLWLTLALSLPSFCHTYRPQTGTCWHFELLPAPATVWLHSSMAHAS